MYALVVACLLSQEPNAQPYDLKGDRLGMSLADYQVKYKRVVPESTIGNCPDCSSSRPGEANDALLTRSWHHAAGIVNCSPVFGFETRAGKGPTVADVPAHLLVHHFIDGKLYKITIVLPRVGFTAVVEGLIAKYGKPNSVQADQRQNVFGAKFTGAILEWTNSVSTIYAGEFGEDRKDVLTGKVSQTSTIIFSHNALSTLADSRKPKPSAKDL